MIIALIGTSGVGKTSWANRLEAAGFTCLHCDDLIAGRLLADGEISAASVDEVGLWMGFPFDPGYAEREARYLAYEADVLAEIARSLPQAQADDRQLVIDMTGSATYIDSTILDAIHAFATFVYLQASPATYNDLLAAYRRAPRPVIWQSIYQPKRGEAPTTTLARCYPLLIQHRARMYGQISDVVLGPEIYQDQSMSVADFLRAVQQQQPGRT